MYIDHKKLNIPEITVEANMRQKIKGPSGEIVTHIERNISYGDSSVGTELQQKLIEIAEKCPVSKILKGEVVIETT